VLFLLHPRTHSMPFLQPLVPSASISGTSTGPFTLSSSIASTTAAPTKSALSGFTPPAPINHVNLPPTALLAIAAIPVTAARGMVNDRLESYKKGARIKIDRKEGKEVDMLVSAARLVVMYLAGRTGAPAAAEM
jgi:hypothetical protein